MLNGVAVIFEDNTLAAFFEKAHHSSNFAFCPCLFRWRKLYQRVSSCIKSTRAAIQFNAYLPVLVRVVERRRLAPHRRPMDLRQRFH